MSAARRALCNFATRKVRISEQVRGQVWRFVTYPPYLTMVFGACDVANQPVQLGVALGRPSRNKTSKVAYSTQQVEACHSRTVEKFLTMQSI